MSALDDDTATLVLEAFYGGSHKVLADIIVAEVAMLIVLKSACECGIC